MKVKNHKSGLDNRLTLAVGSRLLAVVCWLLTMGLCVLHVHAQTKDSLRVSVITCAPGDDMYTLFGHTAIRVVDYQMKDSVTDDGVRLDDWIFNYGAFNFQSEKFVYRFVKGETDYVLAAEPSSMFFKDLIADGRLTTEQVLNLTSYEKKRVFDYLKYNIRPENRVYRYNWLYYNCTNRAKEVIENAVEGRVVYKKDSVARSARDILHGYTSVNSWYGFGIDMVLGTEIDRPLTHDQQMFIPQIYQDELDYAVIEAEDGSVRPLVSEVLYPVEGREYGEEDGCNMPVVMLTLMLTLMLAIGIWEWRRKRVLVWVDVALCALVGIVGLLVAFLFFFSVHPGTSTNWWVIMLNPMPLLFIPFIINRKGTKIIATISLLMILTQMVALMSVQQGYDDAMLILALILLVRIIGRTYIELRINKNTK